MGNRPINRRPWRRAPWRKRLAPGEKGWINGVSTNCGFANLQGSYTCIPEDPDAEAGRTLIEVISGAELADHESNLKVMRIVGDMLFHPEQGAPEMATMRLSGTLVRMGLIVVEADMASGSEVIPYVSPSDMLENADRSWMWLRTLWVPPYDKEIDVGMVKNREQPLERVDVDIRVQRRLKADQRLVLMVQTTNTGILPEDLAENVAPVSVAMNLRAFIAF